MSNHPDVLDETLERIEYELRVKLNSDGVFNPQYNNLLLQIEEAKQQIKSHFRSVEEIEAAIKTVKADNSYEEWADGTDYGLAELSRALGLEGRDE